MSEERKLRFLMRGMKQELFAGLVRNPPKTAKEFISEATTIEKALEIRTRQYYRRMPTTNYGEAHALDTDDLRETIRAVVREELRKMIPASQPQVHSIDDVIRKKLPLGASAGSCSTAAT